MRLKKILKHDRKLLLISVTGEGYMLGNVEDHFAVAQKRTKRARRQYGWAHEAIAILEDEKLTLDQQRRKLAAKDMLAATSKIVRGRREMDGVRESPARGEPRLMRRLTSMENRRCETHPPPPATAIRVSTCRSAATAASGSPRYRRAT